MPTIGRVQLLMHIGDHSTVFGRVRVHWSIHVEMSELVRLSMNYEDSNWFKPDKIWILRKFADSWNGSGEAENALLLPKQIETLATAKLLSNISKRA